MDKKRVEVRPPGPLDRDQGEASEVLTSGAEYKGTPKNSVIKRKNTKICKTCT